MENKEGLLEIGHLPNPLENPPWTNCSPISISEILLVHADQLISPEKAQRNQWATRDEHIRRIAYLVKNKDSRAITIITYNRGLPSPAWWWPIKDGNHRLAAAIVRGDDYIKSHFL